MHEPTTTPQEQEILCPKWAHKFHCNTTAFSLGLTASHTKISPQYLIILKIRFYSTVPLRLDSTNRLFLLFRFSD